MSHDNDHLESCGSINHTRRRLLKFPAVGFFASTVTGTTSTATAQPSQEAVDVTMTDLTGDGKPDVRLENGKLSFQLNSEDIANDSPTYASTVSPAGTNTPYIERLIAQPKSPINFTDSPAPEFRQLKSFTVTQDKRTVGSFKIIREYTVNGDSRGDEQPIEVTMEITMYAGDPFVIANYTVKNISGKRLRIDQDNADIHDGTQVFSHLHLAGRTGTEDDYRFHLNGQGTSLFDRQSRWSTYNGAKWGTIFDDAAGATFGWLNGTTSPKMWITNGKPANVLDYLVGELTLAPGEQFTHELVIGVHKGGTGAPALGAEIYEAAKARSEGSTPVESPLKTARDNKLAITAEVDRLAATIDEEGRVIPTLNGLQTAVDSGAVPEETAIEAVERMILVEDLAELSLAGLSISKATVGNDEDSLAGEPAGSMGVDPSMNVVGTTGGFVIESVLTLTVVIGAVSTFVVKLGRYHPVAGQLLESASKAADMIDDFLNITGAAKKHFRQFTDEIWQDHIKDEFLEGNYESAETLYEEISGYVDAAKSWLSDILMRGYESGENRANSLDDTLARVDSELSVDDGGPTFGGGTTSDGPIEESLTAADTARTLITDEIETAQERLNNNEWVATLIGLIESAIVIGAGAAVVSGGISLAATGVSLAFSLPALVFVYIGLVRAKRAANTVLNIVDEAATAVVEGNPEVNP